MDNKRILVLALLILFGCKVVVCQEPERNKAVYLVKNPELIKLKLLPRMLEHGEDALALKKPYTQGDKLYFRLEMTNTSIAPVEIPVGDPYFQNHPRLYKDGDLLEYREQISKLVQSREKEPSEHVRGWTARLDPSESRVLDRINLHDWYDNLRPGHYQLSVKHRFQLGQEWIESSSITFEVLRKTKDN